MIINIIIEVPERTFDKSFRKQMNVAVADWVGIPLQTRSEQ